MAARKRLATAADLRALNRGAGPVVRTYPPDGSRGRLAIPDAPRSRRQRRGR